MTYKTERIAAPEPDAQQKINARNDDAVLYLRDLRNYVNRIAKSIDAARASIAKKAVDADVTHPRLRDEVADLTYLEGEHRAATEYYAHALAALAHRDDLSLDLVNAYVRMEAMERFIHIASDDAWSGHGNDDRRRIREGWVRAMEKIKYLPQVPAVIPPKNVEEVAV